MSQAHTGTLRQQAFDFFDGRTRFGCSDELGTHKEASGRTVYKLVVAFDIEVMPEENTGDSGDEPLFIGAFYEENVAVQCRSVDLNVNDKQV